MPRELSPIEFARFRAEVLALYSEPMRRIATLRKIRQVLDELEPHCSVTSELTPLAVSAWLVAHPGRSPATRRSLLSALRAACGYGDFRGYLANPFGYRGLAEWLTADDLADDEMPADSPFKRHRSAAEIRAVLAQADREAVSGCPSLTAWESARLRALVYSAAYTGAGSREILGLRVIDFDLSNGLISVRPHSRRRLKRRARAARLPIAAPLAEVLGQWLPATKCEWAFPHKYLSGPWFGGSRGSKPHERVKALGERAGVTGLTILDFRHTVGTLSEGWGIGELMLQRLLRHSRRETQRHYRHEDLDQLRRAAELIRYD